MRPTTTTVEYIISNISSTLMIFLVLQRARERTNTRQSEKESSFGNKNNNSKVLRSNPKTSSSLPPIARQLSHTINEAVASISRCNSKESQNKFSLGYHKIVIHQGTTRFFHRWFAWRAANISKVCSQNLLRFIVLMQNSANAGHCLIKRIATGRELI